MAATFIDILATKYCTRNFIYKLTFNCAKKISLQYFKENKTEAWSVITKDTQKKIQT